MQRTTTGVKATAAVLTAIFWKGLKYYLRYPGSFLLVIVTPFLFALLVLGMGQFVGSEDAASNFALRTGTTNILVYEILGSAVWMISWVVVEDLGVALRDEQMKGTLEQNFMAPVNRITLLVGLSLTCIVIISTVFFAVVGATVALIMPMELVRLMEAFLMLLIGLIPLLGIGFLLAGFVVRFKEPYIITQMVSLLFATLTGTYYPVTILPVWVQFFSYMLPQTYVIDGMRQIVLANRTLVELYGSIIALIVLSFVFPTLGYAAFKHFETKGSATGEFSKY